MAKRKRSTRKKKSTAHRKKRVYHRTKKGYKPVKRKRVSIAGRKKKRKRSISGHSRRSSGGNIMKMVLPFAAGVIASKLFTKKTA